MTDDIVSQWKILIVDDDLDNQMLAAEYMKYLGATVRTASDGVSGLEILKDFAATIILMDLSMPIMDGWTMVGEVRKLDAFTNTPIIALTAHAMPEVEGQVKAAGFTGYVTKPFVFSRLLREIKHWLAEREMAADSSQTSTQEPTPEPVPVASEKPAPPAADHQPEGGTSNG